MIYTLLQEFAQTNFGDKNYLPVLHGRTPQIKLLVLVTKNVRSFWERPWRRYRYTVLAGLERYVVSSREQEFMEAKNKYVKRDSPDLVLIDEEDDEDVEEDNQENDEEDSSRDIQGGFEFGNCANVKIRINQEHGSLDLGKLREDYILDVDLREILADAELDKTKVEVFEGQKLRLITSVVYSERFALKGNRKTEIELDGGASIPNSVIAVLKAHFKARAIPPKMATRNTPGAFLFKCSRVVYNRDKNRLELGELVGKDIERGEEDDEKEEYENTAIGLEEYEESDLADFLTDEDCQKLEIINTTVLIPTKDREERKARVNKYLQWFVEALTKEQKKLFLDEPLSKADCTFLRSIFVPAHENHRVVNLTAFTEDKIQGYAIALKRLSELSEEQWDEVEKAWAE